MTQETATSEADELAAPQTIEAYRAARGGLRAAQKQIYLLEQKLEAARRSNGLMVEQMHAERDRATALSAELDEVREKHTVALGLTQMALDAVSRKVAELERELGSSRDTFRELPEGSPMADVVRPRCECKVCRPGVEL